MKRQIFIAAYLTLAGLVGSVTAQEAEWTRWTTSDGDAALIARHDGEELIRLGCLAQRKSFFVRVQAFSYSREAEVHLVETVLPIERTIQTQLATMTELQPDLVEALRLATSIRVVGNAEEIDLQLPGPDVKTKVVEFCAAIMEEAN